MPDDELPEGGQVRSRPPRKSFADWLMALGLVFFDWDLRMQRFPRSESAEPGLARDASD